MKNARLVAIIAAALIALTLGIVFIPNVLMFAGGFAIAVLGIFGAIKVMQVPESNWKPFEAFSTLLAMLIIATVGGLLFHAGLVALFL